MDVLIFIVALVLMLLIFVGVYGIIKAFFDRLLPPPPMPPVPEAAAGEQIDPQVAEWRRRKAQRQRLHAELMGPDTQG